jgi:cytoskeletal protein CcmA (bactofilin family)
MFSRTHEPARKAAKRSTSFSVIGPDVVVTGDITTGENLQVSGRIDGDVRCAELHQAAGSAIAGNIAANEVRLAGMVTGTVTASVVTLEATARVSGEVSYATLSIDSGARVDGRFTYREEAAADEPNASRVSLDDIFPHEDAVGAAE